MQSANLNLIASPPPSFSFFRGDQGGIPGRGGRHRAQRARRHDGLVHGAACAHVGQGRVLAVRESFGRKEPDLQPVAAGFGISIYRYR